MGGGRVHRVARRARQRERLGGAGRADHLHERRVVIRSRRFFSGRRVEIDRVGRRDVREDARLEERTWATFEIADELDEERPGMVERRSSRARACRSLSSDVGTVRGTPRGPRMTSFAERAGTGRARRT